MAQPERRWQDKPGQAWPLEERARLSFADAGNPNASRNRHFFFHAFDTWVGVDPGAEMRKLFRVRDDGDGELPLARVHVPGLVRRLHLQVRSGVLTTLRRCCSLRSFWRARPVMRSAQSS